MATATLSVPTPVSLVDNDQKSQFIYGQIKISAATDTYATGGLALNAVLSAIPDVQSSTGKPLMVWITSANGSGYTYQWNQSTGKMQIFQSAASGSPLGEYGNGVALTNPFADVILFEAIYQRQ